jgi:hypothetical protein
MKSRFVPTIALAAAFLLTGCDPKGIKMLVYMWSQNLKSLDFYGKIVDQDGLPVEGVRVTAGVGTIVSFAESGGGKYYTVSDARGRFSFTGIHGAGCGYWLEKEGFEFNRLLPCAVRPKDFVPDPNKPVVFPVWRLRGPESLSSYRIEVRLAPDGTPRNLDPATGRKDVGALVATYTRRPVNPKQGEPYDGTLTMEINGGGFVDVTGTVSFGPYYPYDPPSTGYKPSVSIDMPATRRTWGQGHGAYYIFDGKHYGFIRVELSGGDFQRRPYLDVHCDVNPSGSRNLEPSTHWPEQTRH